jgi:hypothetical protein
MYPISVLAIGVVCSIAFAAQATIVGGGGRARTDCLAVFSTSVDLPGNHRRNIRCVDGDPACDADETVDGVCTFPIGVCANSTFDAARCVSTGVESVSVSHAIDDGTDPGFDVDFQALQGAIDSEIAPPNTNPDVCTTPVNIQVRITGPFGKPLAKRDRCRPKRKTVRLFAQPHPLVGNGDSDRLRLTCVPASAEANGCDAMSLFSGTFDRLQKEVFSASCAVGTCHDSESMTGALLLEPGAAYDNLVGHDPTNGAARALGWKRVNPGDPSTSFLYHKITNDLTQAGTLGLRMPRPPGRPMLHASLREIVRLWITAGAPATGWVPGTF